MPHDRRNDPDLTRSEHRHGRRYPTGSDRDRYRSGEEQRYRSDRDRRHTGRSGAYEGDRSYAGGGYAEEFGYRRDSGHEEWRGEQDSDQDFDDRGTYERGTYEQPPRTSRTQGASNYAGQGAWSERSADNWPHEDEEVPAARAHRSRYAELRARYDAGPAYERDIGHRREPYRSEDSYRDRVSGHAGRTGFSEVSSFRGRGPKGYQRSDERLRELICEALTEAPHIDAADITVEVRQQAVKLTGTVEDRSAKYAAEELVARYGIQDIDNQLRARAKIQKHG